MQSDLKVITCNIQNLENERAQFRNFASVWKSCFSPRRTAKQGLEILDIKSRMKKQLADMADVKKKTSKTFKAIRELKASLSANSGFERAKIAYRSRWTGEEECCKAKGEELSTVLEQLTTSKAEVSKANEELKITTELFETWKTEEKKHSKRLESVEVQLQATNQRSEDYKKDVETIRKKLRNAYFDIANMLSDEGIRNEVGSDSHHPTREFGPQSTPAEDITCVMALISRMTEAVACRRELILKTIRGTEKRLGDYNRSIEECKDRIEQMLPLYEVGLDTRHRKYELDMNDIKYSRPDWDLVNKGNEAAHNGRALADATVFQDFCTTARPHRYPGEFEDQYNKVPAKVVWEHKQFTMFHNMLSWHMDMRQFGPAYKKERFDREFEFLFSKIYPPLSRWPAMKQFRKTLSCGRRITTYGLIIQMQIDKLRHIGGSGEISRDLKEG